MPPRYLDKMSIKLFIKPVIYSATLALLSACSSSPVAIEPLPDFRNITNTNQVLEQKLALSLAQPLSTDKLATIAVFNNPDLQLFRTSEGVAEAQLFATELFPDPSFSIGFDAPLNGQSIIPAIGLSLGYDFSNLFKRSFMLQQMQASLDKVRFDIAWIEWLTGQQAQLQATRISQLRHIKSLTAQFRTYAQHDLVRVLKAVSRGDLAAVELETRRIAATDAADRDRSAELQLRIAELDLNRLLGINSETQLIIQAPELNRQNSLPDMGLLFETASANRADILGLQTGYKVASTSVDIAKLGAYPLPNVSLNLGRDTSNIKTFGPNISFTLPLWNRGQGDIAIAKANLNQLRSEYLAQLQTIRADIATTYTQLNIVRAQRNDVEDELSPLLPQLTSNDHAAKRGDLSQSIADATHMTVLDKQILIAGLALAEAELHIALEIAVGQSIENIQ